MPTPPVIPPDAPRDKTPEQLPIEEPPEAAEAVGDAAIPDEDACAVQGLLQSEGLLPEQPLGLGDLLAVSGLEALDLDPELTFEGLNVAWTPDGPCSRLNTPVSFLQEEQPARPMSPVARVISNRVEASSKPSLNGKAGRMMTQLKTAIPSGRKEPRVSPGAARARAQQDAPKPKKRSTKTKKTPQAQLQELRSTWRTEPEVTLPRAPLRRLILSQVREESQRAGGPYRIQEDAISAVMVAAQYYLTGLFHESHLCTLHRKKVTLQREDWALAQRLRECHKS